MDNLIYKRNGAFLYGEAEKFVIQSESELSDIEASTLVQVAVILGDGTGGSVRFRLPGGSWTEF